MHCRGPASLGVQELLACACRKVADRALGDAILEVGVYATQGESLSCVFSCLFKCIVFKSSVVAMVMKDSHAVVGGELFECALGLDCFVGAEILHQMYESQTGVVVHEDGGAGVSARGEFARYLSVKANLW